MARHNIYLSPEREQLLELLGLTRQGWSSMLNDAIDLLIAGQPPAKVERAARRVARQVTSQLAADLMPRSGA